MRTKQFIFTVALPIFISMLIGAAIIIFCNNFIIPSRARALIISEQAEMNKTIDTLNAEKKTLSEQSENYDKIINENKTLVRDVQTLKTTLDNYTSDVENAAARNKELDSQLESKKTYLNSLSEVKEEEKTYSADFPAGEYKCPGAIPPGRYEIEGEAKIYLYAISNALTTKCDLSTTDTHTFKLNITSGESLKIEGGTVKVTSLDGSEVKPPTEGMASATEKSTDAPN